MFRPNTVAYLQRKNAKRDIHGKESYLAPVPLPCALVSLTDRVVESSVRADSTASRGAAEQEVLQAKILIPIHVAVKKGDVIKIAGRLVEIASIQPRNDVFGRPHHQEIGGNIKGDM
jgi:hypothetical protein